MNNKTDIEENIERLAKENVELKNQVITLRQRPVFYYDNNRNTYSWCCRCADSNMSLHMFLENGEILGYASEHYDKWVKNAKEVKQIDVCEFMHKFVKPLIIKANKYDSLIENIKKKKSELENQCGGNIFHVQQTLNAEIRLLEELEGE